MTLCGAHIRRLDTAEKAAAEARALYGKIRREGLAVSSRGELVEAVRARHVALASAGYLEAIVEYLKAGGGSRGSVMALRDDGAEIHPMLVDPDTGRPYRLARENEELRSTIAELVLADAEAGTFSCRRVAARPIPSRDQPFELAWTAYRTGEVFLK